MRSWRNITAAELEPDAVQTLLLGGNGHGKSNVLEAVYALATATSFRCNRDQNLVQWDQPAAHLRASVEGPDGRTTIELGIDSSRDQKVVKVDGTPLPRLADLYGRLRVTLLAPEDMALVCGSPEDRRRYLDMTAAQLDRRYVQTLQAYRRAIRQRNQVLRQLPGATSALHEAHLQAWDHQVATLGAEIMIRRTEITATLSPHVKRYHAALADDCEALDVAYRPSVIFELGAEESAIRDALSERRARDIEQGSTSCGPHRDDLRLRLSGRDLAVSASQGQRRTVALALRLAEAEAVSEEGGRPSLLLIDDVVYEMDTERRARFWNAIPAWAQRIVTATNTEHLGQKSFEGRVYHVQHGEIRST